MDAWPRPSPARTASTCRSPWAALLGGLACCGRSGSHAERPAARRHLGADAAASSSPGLELLRRSRPRAALVIGTLALVADQFTAGNLALGPDVHGHHVRGRRLRHPGRRPAHPGDHGAHHGGRDDRLPRLVAATRRRSCIGVVTGLVSFAPADHRRARAQPPRGRRQPPGCGPSRPRCSPRWTACRPSPPSAPGWPASCTTWSPTTSPRSPSTPRPRSPSTTRRPPATPSAVIRENSVEGLAEMRRLIGHPAGPERRRGADGLRPPWTASRVPGRQTRATNGLDVTLDDTRDPDGPQAPRPGRARGVPHRPGVPDQRPQARVARPGHGDAHPSGGARSKSRVTSPFGYSLGPPRAGLGSRARRHAGAHRTAGRRLRVGTRGRRRRRQQ